MNLFYNLGPRSLIPTLIDGLVKMGSESYSHINVHVCFCFVMMSCIRLSLKKLLYYSVKMAQWLLLNDGIQALL